MNRTIRGALALAFAAATTAALMTPSTAATDPDRLPGPSVGGGQRIDAVFSPRSTYHANWTRADALKIQQDATNTAPLIPSDFPVMTDQVWIWDTWPLTNLNMQPVAYEGWNIIFSLTAPRDIFFGDRHWQAKIGFFYSQDAEHWTYGGDLFPAGASLGSREWAGSTVLADDGTVHAFYTASGHDDGGIDPTDALQRLAHSQGQIHTDADGVWFTGFENHQIIAQADGTLYQTLEQSQAGPIIYAFRDPFVFRDPTDHRVYALFEGNNGGVAGTHTCDRSEIGRVPPGHVTPADARYYTGNIGLMELKSADFTQWKLLPPLLSAECTNQQTERPHLVVRDGQYYLWTISHMFTFAPGLTDPGEIAAGPDGVYGFVGPGLRSNYRPMNGSALVLGNPPEQPLQQYSHYVMPNLLVESFIDTVPTGPGPSDVVYGGTLAPTLELELDGATSRLVGQLPYAYVPAEVAVP